LNTIFIILIAVSLFAVSGIVKKIIADRKHLTGEEFRAYMDGAYNMSDNERSRVTSHLGICEKCQGQVDTWIKEQD